MMPEIQTTTTANSDDIKAAAALLRAEGWYLLTPEQSKMIVQGCKEMQADIRTSREIIEKITNV